MKRYGLFLVIILFSAWGGEARSVINLNSRWEFFTDQDTDSDQAAVIFLPHTWNDGLGGIAGGFYRGVGNYMKDVDIPYNWRGKRIFLRIGGASNVTDVFINGRHLTEHRGGNSAFTIEITERLIYGQANKLQITVNNSPRLDVFPTAGEENQYGGLFRGAELIVTEQLAVDPAVDGTDGVRVSTTKISDRKVEGNVELKLLPLERIPSKARARVRVLDNDNNLVAQNSVGIIELTPENRTLTMPFSVNKPRLWQGVEDPYLYDVEIMLTWGDDMVADSMSIRTGFRTVSRGPDNKLLLNGVPYEVRGVTVHRDRLLAGNAVSPFQIEEDIDLIREMGANAVRIAGGQHNDYFYTLCDEAGLLVWSDIPFTGSVFFTDRDFVDSPSLRENGLRQLRETIAQLYNHPSVVMWGLFSNVLARGDNPVPYIRELNDEAHRLDATRLTVASSTQDGDINFITDLIVFDQSFGWLKGMPEDITLWMEQMRRSWSHLPAGVTYSAGGSLTHQSEKLEKPVVLSLFHPENWQTYFHEEYLRNLAGNRQFWGIFVGNLFDFGAARRTWGEAKGINNHGLVTFNRKDRKDAFWLYKANWNNADPFVYIVGKRLDSRSVRRQNIKVYSNQSEVELFLANRSLGKRKGKNGIFIWQNVELRPGINRIEARSGNLRDRSSINVDVTEAALRPQRQTHRTEDLLPKDLPQIDDRQRIPENRMAE